MKGPIGFGRVVNIVMNIILGLCMSLVMLTAAGVPLLPEIVIEAWFARRSPRPSVASILRRQLARLTNLKVFPSILSTLITVLIRRD